MIIHRLRDAPDAALASALSAFEPRFTYPLGTTRTFSISHAPDYARFFRSLGVATTFIAEQNGTVLGTVGVAIRPVQQPDGTQRLAAYIGDLKIDPAARGSFVLIRLAAAALTWARPQVDMAFGIAMDGTPLTPDRYTGRTQIPSFAAIQRVAVLRFDTSTSAATSSGIVTDEVGEACYRRLSRGRFAALGGAPSLRSELPPTWLIEDGGQACGRLEDTRSAKRLIASDGIELQSAHLACFAWITPPAACRLIESARASAALLGFPALFIAVSQADIPALASVLEPIDKWCAPATIYGTGIDRKALWNISSSEI